MSSTTNSVYQLQLAKACWLAKVCNPQNVALVVSSILSVLSYMGLAAHLQC